MRKGTGIVAVVISTVVGMAIGGKLVGKSVIQKTDKINKFKNYYSLLNQWLTLKQGGKSLEEYFIKNGYKTIAIYGMGEMGNRLYNELNKSSIEVKYAIDEAAEKTYADIDIFGIDDNLPEVDVIVVSAVFAYDEIETKLAKEVNYTIVSLEDVVYEV